MNRFLLEGRHTTINKYAHIIVMDIPEESVQQAIMCAIRAGWYRIKAHPMESYPLEDMT